MQTVNTANLPRHRLLVANRGEVSIRITRAAQALGWHVTAGQLHGTRADECVALPGSGPSAYLDLDAILHAARASGCTALHPGYGFLSENPQLAQRCADAGLLFVGPNADVLALLGHKADARALAQRCGVPVLPGSPGAVTLEQARDFWATLPEGAALMLKAVAGGGGRGLRAVQRAEDLAAAYSRCAAEARANFGQPALYAELWLPQARHIEVQVVGDQHGAISALGERECSIQRQHQKLLEVAPSPSLGAALRQRITAAALLLAKAAHVNSLCTFEFLVTVPAADGQGHASDTDSDCRYYFIEANPRLQVEHTVTEAVLGLDLVQAQLAVAVGAPLQSLQLDAAQILAPRGHALQLRVNAETLDTEGRALPQSGVLQRFDVPTGPGVRVDSAVRGGSTVGTSYDTLLAKLVVHSTSARYADAVALARRALAEFSIEGVATNQALLARLLAHPDVVANRVHTQFLQDHLLALGPPSPVPMPALQPAQSAPAGHDPPAGLLALRAPLQGCVVALALAPGQTVPAGAELVVLEAMKMQHGVAADTAAVVHSVHAVVGQTVAAGALLALLQPTSCGGSHARAAPTPDPAHLRPDLAALNARIALTQDAARSAAVARRHASGLRTARQNIEQLFDAGSFKEYGALAVAAQRRRRTLQDLIENTPADGVVAGLGTINADRVGPERAQCMAVVYDYTVLAGTQGAMNHKKQDRLFRLAERQRLPLVLYAEGGGGRPGDTDHMGLTGLDCSTFAQFARLAGQVPLVGVVAGRCFAGNAALLGCCDVIIATRGASIGMGGPAMIEGGGLGVVAPEDVGPAPMHARSGVVDMLVDDEAQATAVAQRYLSYFQGPVQGWTAADQRLLRHAVPENRLRAYDVRALIALLADTDSVLELRPDFGLAMVTALVRIEGRPLGLLANSPQHGGGAIDAQASDKAARFMRLCSAHGLPIVSLCDTPGFMVGPQAETTALVRHTARMFLAAAALRVPFFTVVLRKAYGLGAQAMAAGGFHEPLFTVAWPTGEFGGMGLDGFVRLGYRKELQAIEDPAARQDWFNAKLAELVAQGQAQSIASVLEIDAVIDPQDTRRWLLAGLSAAANSAVRSNTGESKAGCLDSW
jgi:acetyl/propionyl-CoA carboxylase alpha subunit/acetyl-CoA carboxylase carboxyltransferase component